MSCGKCEKCQCGALKQQAKLLELLAQSGFVRGVGTSPRTTSYIKTMEVGAMPYAREHIVGTLCVTEKDTALIEYCAETGEVSFSIHAVNYFEEPVPAESEDGKGLLRDAGVNLG